MTIEPKVGMVIRYDYLWKDEEKRGRIDGSKDRPCAIIVASKPKEDKTRDILVCPITHSPPQKGESSVEIPHKVAERLNLDNDRMWIKTNEVNKFEWQEGRIPCGMSQTPQGEWSYGTMPYELRGQAWQQVRDNSRERSLEFVNRNKEFQPVIEKNQEYSLKPVERGDFGRKD